MLVKQERKKSTMEIWGDRLDRNGRELALLNAAIMGRVEDGKVKKEWDVLEE